MTCTWTFDTLKFGTDWLYAEDLITDSPIMTSLLTFNYTDKSSVPVTYDCDTFPYPQWTGSATHEGGGGGISYVDDEDEEVVVIQAEDTVSPPDQDDSIIKDDSVLDTVIEAAKKALGITDTPKNKDEAETGDSSDDDGWLTTNASKAKDFLAQYWLAIVIGGAGIVFLIYTWRYLFTVLKWLAKLAVLLGKALMIVIVPLAKIIIAGLMLLWAFMMTPVGFIIVGTIIVLAYMAIKIFL